MKRLLLILTTIAGFSATAQKDLSVTLTQPVNNQSINAGQQFTVSTTLKNEGTVTISASDTLLVQFTLNGQVLTFGSSNAFLVTHGDINAGQSVTHSLNMNFSSKPPMNSIFCVVGVILGNSDPVTANNQSCVNGINSQNGVDEFGREFHPVKVYPNPALSHVFFASETAKTSKIAIMDITGKLIETVATTGNETRVDLSAYNNGIYLYQMISEEGSMLQSGKFSVSK